MSAILISSVLATVWSRFLLTIILGYREPLVYNTKVATSLMRQVYQAERLAPPLELGAWTNAYAHMWARGTNFGWWRDSLRNGSWVGLSIMVSLDPGSTWRSS